MLVKSVVVVMNPLDIGAKMAWEALIGAGANLLGGVMNMFQGDVARGRQADMINNQQALQREFATTGITWRARDAMRAYEESGIHPLALLGVQGPTYSPVSASFEPDRSMGNALSDAGQNISRAMLAAETEKNRQAFAARLDHLTVERAALENTLLKTRIAAAQKDLTSPAIGPAMPVSNRWQIDGQGNSEPQFFMPGAPTNLIKEKPMERSPGDPGRQYQEPGSVSSIGWLRNQDGTYSAVKSEDAQKRLEDDFWGNTKHFVTRTFGLVTGPYPAPPGKVWKFDWKGDWYLGDPAPNDVYRRGRHPSQRD